MQEQVGRRVRAIAQDASSSDTSPAGGLCFVTSASTGSTTLQLLTMQEQMQ